MKISVNQFNMKRSYYKVWFPILNKLRFHALRWYVVDLMYDEDISSSVIVSSFDQLSNLSDYKFVYCQLITNARYNVEYGGCLNFLLSCSPCMLKIFAQDVLHSCPMYDDIDEVLDEIHDIIDPYKC